jgi:hypothetical protein
MSKISLNQWYAGSFWANRKKIKDDYYWLIKSQCKKVFPKDRKYDVEYEFGFKSRPLDTSNTIAMVKMIEDVIFESDSYKIVKNITMSSNKSDTNYVKITINEY